MFCGYCGKENAEDYNFCAKCGKPKENEAPSQDTIAKSRLEDTSTAPQVKRGEEGKKRNKLLIVLFFLVGILFFLKLFFDHSMGIYFAGTGRLSSILGQAVGYSMAGLILPFLVFIVGKMIGKNWVDGFAISAIIFELLGIMVFISNQYNFWGSI